MIPIGKYDSSFVRRVGIALPVFQEIAQPFVAPT